MISLTDRRTDELIWFGLGSLQRMSHKPRECQKNEIIMSSPSPHDVTDEAIIAEEGADPAQQLDESSPPANEEAAEEERPPSATASASEPEPGPEPGGGPTAPTEESDKPTAGGGPPPTARSRAKSPSVSARGTASPGGKLGRRGGGRGDAAAATATARPPPDDDDDDDNDAPPEAASTAGASASVSSPMPFTADEYPQLVLDDSADHSGLATAFRRPLFGGADGGGGGGTPACSRPLAIAYSHLADASRLRRRAVRRRNATLAEYESLRARFLKKKHELSLAEDELGEHDRRTGAWTRKVFDLELEEPCEWRNGYERLRRYREERGRLPPSVKKARDEEERSVSDWLHQM